MSTEKKIESNRKNAQKSTGPKSDEGKTVVSQNARTHGFLSRNLVSDGESQEEFSELMSLLVNEFQPAGLVEHALVERVGIALWRQRRLVQAESAEVSLNQQRFGDDQKNMVGKILDLGVLFCRTIRAPGNETEDGNIALINDAKEMMQSFIDDKIADTENPFDHLPAEFKQHLPAVLGVDANEVDSYIKEQFGSWAVMFETRVEHFKSLIQEQRIREVSRLLMKSQALPSRTDLLSRYQTALDNDFYKALKALREAQAWRQSKAMISVTPVHPDGDGTEA